MPRLAWTYAEVVDLDAPMRNLFDRLPDMVLDAMGEERFVELSRADPDRLEAAVHEAVAAATARSGRALAEHLKYDGPPMLARRRAERRGFERRLARRWARPIDLAEMALVVAYEAGEAFNATHRPQAAAQGDAKFEVLVQLHARACRIAEEILVLLKAGFGQAAQARWRALHEVAVVALFIKQHDQDTAERYLLHENIEGYRALRELEPLTARLDHDPISDAEIRAAQEAYDDLVARYGPKYAGPYGWAHAALVSDDSAFNDRVTFATLEEAVELDHLRPYYRMASHGTHANPKGILFTPDLMSSQPPILLAGPSSTGFADPGQSALISLNQVTATLLTYRTGESAPIVLTALLRLIDEAAHAFVETQHAVEASDCTPRYGPLARRVHLLEPRVAEARVHLARRLAGRQARVRDRAKSVVRRRAR